MVERPDISAALISLKIIWNTVVRDDDLSRAAGGSAGGDVFREFLVVAVFRYGASFVTLF